MHGGWGYCPISPFPCPASSPFAISLPSASLWDDPCCPRQFSLLLALGVKSHELQFLQVPLDDDVVKAFSIPWGSDRRRHPREREGKDGPAASSRLPGL